MIEISEEVWCSVQSYYANPCSQILIIITLSSQASKVTAPPGLLSGECATPMTWWL